MLIQLRVCLIERKRERKRKGVRENRKENENIICLVGEKGRGKSTMGPTIMFLPKNERKIVEKKFNESKIVLI